MSRVRILYVDDEDDIREVAAFALGLDPDFEVEALGSGREVLERLHGGARPDLILLDVMMPGLDGPATLDLIRGLPAGADIPVAFVTARAQPHERAAFAARGACGVITKPFDPMALAAEVRTLLEEVTS